MIEKTVLDYLASKLTVPVYMERPEKLPASCVIIEKTGGSGDRFFSQSTFAIQSYAETLYEAAVLNAKVKDVMDYIRDDTDVTRAVRNGDYNFTDPDEKRYRYQCVYEIYHY